MATIGFFDGVHIGHRYLIDRIVAMGREQGLASVIVTFDRQPRQVLQPDYRPQLLSPLNEKLRLLAATGADGCAVLHFTKEMARMSAWEFMNDILHTELKADTLLTGYDNRFGHDRTETFSDYADYGRQMGMTVMRGKPVETDGTAVSSSLIRSMLTEGRIAQASVCLGRPYELEGPVVHGRRIGHRLGFPTANILIESEEKLIPASGVYAVRVQIDNNGPWHNAMTNIGQRPTFSGSGVTIETHIFGLDDDLYGHRLRVQLIDRLRDEQPFGSAEALSRQLFMDKTKAVQILNNTL